MCLQYDLFLQTTMGSEDCLTLNVYTPQVRICNDLFYNRKQIALYKTIKEQISTLYSANHSKSLVSWYISVVKNDCW